MSLSQENNKVENIKLGACSITFKGSNLGMTKGGVDVDVITETHPVVVDQSGDIIRDDIIKKRSIKITCPLAETTLRNLVATMPGANLIEIGGEKASGEIIFSKNPVISVNAVAATGNIVFSSNPADNDTININSVVKRFKTTLTVPAVDSEIKIGANAWYTANSLISLLQKSKDARLTQCNFKLLPYDAANPAANTIVVIQKTTGLSGNAFSISSPSAAIKFPTSKLAGGTATVAAKATLTPTVNPANNTTLTVNGVVFTFKTVLTSPAVETEILLGSTTALTLGLIATTLNASTNPLISVANYTNNATMLTVTFGAVGGDGNAFTLSGPANWNIESGKLTGGIDAIIGDVIVINDNKFQFKTHPYEFSDIKIGETTQDTLLNAVGVINTSVNPEVNVTHVVLEPSSDPNVGKLLIESDTNGVDGNNYTIATIGSSAIASNDTLTGGLNSSRQRVEVNSGIGKSLLKTAGRLTLHPINLDPSNTSEDVIIPLANTPGSMKFAFKFDQERIYNVEFMGYIDPDTKLLYMIGDDIGS